MRFAYLSEYPGFAPQLAEWHHGEWADHIVGWSREKAEGELRSHAGRRQVPTTLLALDDQRLLGSVSLLENDHDDMRQYSPWLASLFVAPAYRGRGVGAALCRRLVQEAAALRIATLYLYTLDTQDFYRRLGWQEVDRIDLLGSPASVMRILPVQAVASSTLESA